MRILISGASGTIGKAFIKQLEPGKHQVKRLVRRAPSGPDEVQWDPVAGGLDPAIMDATDAVVNLSGAGIAGAPWTRSYKETLYSSRLTATRTLVESMRRADSPPTVFLSQSASGYYGNRGSEVLPESAASGDLLLSDICRRWEAEALRAPSSVRTVLMRTGVVMSTSGGALPKLLVPLRFFVGGPLGSGNQWWPWVTLDDQVRAMAFLLEAEVSGPVNISSPSPATLTDLTEALGAALNRPTRFRVPEWVLTAVLGQLAKELLLPSARLDPTVLKNAGFKFRHSSLDDLARWVRESR
ncbi:TIGR01777 family oxidoreductase [Arthrobacter sp. Bz4]|uniref:TIGR01777 family oxidoreductase n=2 Tax=unclassified Arthrobacter TaxID=235627 RepID=UPI000D51053D|nr:TIGR01777 family oxidoreductase [Arthrobacter sp. Bz4]PVE19459.1 TIGR01777 family protein [Arthrobacter sp. Bz4]